MGLLVVISGSSGAGKDAVLRRMEETAFPFCRVVTVTTRSPRPGEKDGADYNFISEPRFREMVQRDERLEWAEVYGNFYGVPKQQIAGALSQGQDAIVRVDVQGAATIKRTLPGAVLIFLAPESTGEYEERLKRRSTESDADLRLRVESIQKEVQ
ncbi:MAG: guanylate kinase, partial [Chloroflexi bacterium]|nr:guanylate kinase [Chloroflexota bacterium]